jgi:hypothetical protein
MEMATMQSMRVPGTTVNRKRCKIIASENPQDLSGKGRTNAPTERSDGTVPAIKARNTSNPIKKEA